MRFVYVLLAYLLAPVVCGVMLWRGFKDRSYWRNFSERFGFGMRIVGGRSIWVHAVSVGEVQASAALVRALRALYPEAPLVLTTVTPTGAERARRLFGDDVHVRFVPYDLPGSVRRFLARVNPRVAIILETELWPNLYAACGSRGVPLVLASARISPRSVGRYRKLAVLFRDALAHGIVIAAQSPADAARFRSIGANPSRTHVVGNIKFDLALPADFAEAGAVLRACYAGEGRPVWVAGSTHDGEEQAVLQAQRRLEASGLRPLLVLVPRHPNRFDDVAEWLEREGVRFVRRSSDPRAGAASVAVAAAPDPSLQVLLVDTVGELMQFYAAADLAFVGGSLVPIGGHNLLEPSAAGIPVITGPHNFNAEDIAQLLIEQGGTTRIVDAASLAEAVEQRLRDRALAAELGSRGRRAVEENRGALQRLLELLRPVIDATSSAASR